MRMDWERLLKNERYSTGRKAPVEARRDKINTFQEDADRLIYCSAFRRLQGKTQVQPLPKIDYVRTRLTHTIEVANVARLLGSLAAKFFTENDQTVDWSELLPNAAGSIVDIVVAASLAHDLGNPPFGHIGEYAIQSYFFENKGREFFEFLDDPKRGDDFLCFDGNAQGFRIVNRLQGWRDRGGLQLTYPVLGAFSKYPWSSMVGLRKYGKKKFGFMQADRSAAAHVFDQLGLGRVEISQLRDVQEADARVFKQQGAAIEFARHPLAWIMEAADDISYRTTDIEDAYRYESITFEEAESLLKPIAEARGHIPRYSDISLSSRLDRLSYLRAGAVSSLIEACAESFIGSYDLIMDGKNTTPLVLKTNFRGQVTSIEKISNEKIYVQRDKMEIEAAGCHVIYGLLREFGSMVVEFMKLRGADNLSMKSRALFNLLPNEFRLRMEPGDSYETFLVLVDYISGMTDDYALELYQKITGSSVSLGRML